jgi:hypothetical protein
MLFPACTGTGLGVLVTERSADPATRTLAEALLVGFESPVGAALVKSVPVIVVPGAVPGFTFTTKVNVALALAARLAMLQV